MFGFKKTIKRLDNIIGNLYKTINNLETEKVNLISKVKQRDKIIKNMQIQIKELKEKNNDLENNVEILYNNLSPAKKKTINR